MSRGPWTLLGIAPTGDTAAIRSAYAARLKTIDVDADPAAFMALRQAFDTARAMASRRQPSFSAGELVAVPVREPEVPPQPERRVEPRPAPEPAPVERPQWVQDIEAIQTLVYGTRSREEIYDEVSERMARILASPEMLNVDHATRIESWAADFILSGIPRTNAVMASAINGFGWFARAAKWDCPPAIIAVLNRNDDCDYLRGLQHSKGGANVAYRLLMDPTRTPSRFHAGKVDNLLTRLRHEHPTVVAELSREAVAAWDALLEKRYASTTARAGRAIDRFNQRIGYWWRRLRIGTIFGVIGMVLGGLLLLGVVVGSSGIALIWIIPALLRRNNRQGGY